ncbi:MAG: transcription termination/antitermination protein NusA, partial [Anaerovoracaceae bacterium]
EMISNALAPAKVEKVIINEDEKSATVIVPDYQLSLAIGKEGQNVRLAAKLTAWKIDIKSSSQYSESADDYIEDEDMLVDYNDNIEEEAELTDGEEMIPSEEDTAEEDAASEEVVEIDE